MSSFDRTDFTPPHTGPHVLPNTPFFSELLRHATSLKHTAIRDLNQDGLSRTYAELLTDAIRLRNVLRARLPRNFLDRINTDKEEICIGVLAAGGYEYVVGVLAVLALGAAVVPMTVALPVREATYFVKKSKQIAIISSESASNLGASIAESVNKEGAPFDDRHPVQSIPITSSMRGAPRIALESVSICSDRYLSDNQAGIVIFSSQPHCSPTHLTPLTQHSKRYNWPTQRRSPPSRLHPRVQPQRSRTFRSQTHRHTPASPSRPPRYWARNQHPALPHGRRLYRIPLRLFRSRMDLEALARRCFGCCGTTYHIQRRADHLSADAAVF